MARQATVAFTIDQLLPHQGTLVLGGTPGIGKSWLLMRMALDVAAGQPWLGKFPVKQRTVLMVDEENARPLIRDRLGKLARGARQHLKKLPLILAIDQGVNFSRDSNVAELEKLVCKHDVGLVTIDSLVRVHDGDENSATEIARMARGLRRIVRCGCSLAFTHHTRKPRGFGNDRANSLRGSSDIRAFVDTQLTLSKTNGELVVSHDKSRWCEAIHSFGVRIGNLANGRVEVFSPGGANLTLSNGTDRFILDVLKTGTVTRKDMLPQAAAAGIPTRSLDRRLKALTRSGIIEKLPRVNRETPYRLKKKPGNSPPP
ncbi:MAG: AAA family ATPase [Anaerolineales bacterium]|jgi:hypothetical protein|nr:AAA family ATPase [Anaerolineales bacterium]